MRKSIVHRFLAVMAFLTGLMSCSCTRIQEPSIQNVRIARISATGLTSADIYISFSITNPNKKALSAETASGEISLDGTVIAEFFLKDTPLTAPALTTSKLEACANIKIMDPLSLLTTGFNLQDPDFSKLTADADVLIKIGDMQHKIRLRKYPLKQLTSHLNI